MTRLTVNQILVVVGMMFCNISDGFIYGQMSGMIDALQADNSPIPVTEDDISWLASTMNLTCTFGYMLFMLVDRFVGRGRAVMLLSLPILATWIILYYAQTKAMLLLSRVIVGVFFGSMLSISYVNIGEYISPKNRPFYTILVCGAGPMIGTMLGHVLSILLHWRHVALIGLIPTSISIVLPMFWQESPSWLASRGQFEACEESFKVVRGSSEEALEELKQLIAHEKTKQSIFVMKNRTSLLSKILTSFRHKYFWKVMALGFTNVIYRVSAGRVLFSTFAITLLQSITGSPDILLFTIAVDAFTVFGALLSCYIIGKLKIRTLILKFGIISNTVLVMLGVSLYVLETGNIYYSYIKVFLFALYFVTVNAGPLAVLEALISEIFPLEIKPFCLLLIGLLGAPSQFLSIKLAPIMFSIMGYHGVFLLNAFIVYLCLFYLWAFLPETKGRSLQEIEVFFRIGRFERKTEVNEPASKLILG